MANISLTQRKIKEKKGYIFQNLVINTRSKMDGFYFRKEQFYFVGFLQKVIIFSEKESSY